MNRVEYADASHGIGNLVEESRRWRNLNQTFRPEIEPTVKELQISFDGGINVDQLKELILGTIKDKFKDGSDYPSPTPSHIPKEFTA